MTTIRTIDETAFSDDYQLLVKAMQERSLICVVDYDASLLRDGSYRFRDVAQTSYDDEVLYKYRIGARGVGYLDAATEADFIAQCRKYNVKFLL